jgi:hypothetical protein
MHSALAFSGMLVVLTASTAPADDNKVLYTAMVRSPEAEVRSGPSSDPKMYATGKLRQGQEVEVVEERDQDWLAIRPPSGSFSWVQTRLLEHSKDRYWIVVTDAPVRIGSELLNEKPTKEGRTLKPGSLVVALGKEMVADDGKWLPIAPPPGEVRYIRADAVARAPALAQGTPPAAAVAVPAKWDGQPDGSRGVPAAAATAPGPTAPLPAAPFASADPLWVAAQQDEQAGRYADAERKYAELGNQVINQNHDLAMQCYNRIQFLREHNRTVAQAGQPNESNYRAPQDGRIVPVPTNPNGQQAGLYVSTCPPQGQTSCYGQPAVVSRSSPPGRLRLAAHTVDCKRAYALESSQGQLLMYVTPEPGVNLEQYMDRNVELYGPLVYRMDLRAQYMLATRVTPMP